MWSYNYSPTLMHHGIKDQRWGFRRFQNKDGTWTEAGKKRYGSDSSSHGKKKTGFLQRMNEKKIAKKAAKTKAAEEKRKKIEAEKAEAEKRAKESAEERKARILKHPTPEEIYKNRDLFTTNELNDLNNRFRYEEEISKKIKKQKTKGEEFVQKLDKFGDTMSTVANVVTNTSKAYNSAAKVINSFTDMDLKLIQGVDGGGKKKKNKNKSNDDDDD